MWIALFVILIAFAVSVITVGWLAHSRLARLVIDRPNARSLHSIPVPRSGGIGLLAGAIAGWFFFGASNGWHFYAAMALVMAVSLADDVRGLHSGLRLAVHLTAASIAAVSLLGAHSLLVLVTAIFFIGWMSNLYNFMDGSDGLAGGMAVSGFLAYAIAAWLSEDIALALANLAVSAAAAGFLVHNFHPARIFLGDTGSVTLGFLAAFFGLTGWHAQHWDWWFPLLVFSPFIVDASVTLARRAHSGARIWEAHRDHYYQRLVRLGFGHRGTALIGYSLMLTCGTCAIFALHVGQAGQFFLLVLFAAAYAAGIALIERAWKASVHHA